MALTQLTALPDASGGVLTQRNLDQMIANVTTENTNFATANTVLGGATGAPVGTGAIQLAPATGIPPAQIDPTLIQYTTVNCTLAQLLATNTVPISLLAAQGAGTLIEVVSLTLDLVRGSAAFSGGGACAAYLGTDSTGVLASATIAATVFTSFAASQLIRVAGAQAVAATSTVLNKGLVFANPTADFTAGTGATGIIKLAYRVHAGLA